ncbi:MAG: hypothetical protein Q9190_007735 [Brigantiaea leucoxantha]
MQLTYLTNLWSHEAHPALDRHRTGHWLPSDHARVRGWVNQIQERSRSFKDKPLEPVLQDFKDFIDNDPLVRTIATDMFHEVPVTPPYNKDPTLEPQIRSYDEMFRCLDVILGEGPQWYKSDDSDAMGLIGCPISAVIEWPMGTKSGYAFFKDCSVNAHWEAVLNRWKTYLSSPASLEALDSMTGWTSADAIEMMTEIGNNGVDNFTFPELYVCNPMTLYYGFKSWDDFFTRKFHDRVRPIAYPDEGTPCLLTDVDTTAVVVHACESTPCFRQENVKLHDNFWLKSQPYSLADMLNGVDKAIPFVGGQVYQAYLSALSYRRWHAPVSGRVVSIEKVPGTYYSENYYEGFANIVDGKPRPNPVAPNNSQPYIAEVTTRGILTILADNPKIGLMAVVFIGMCEVSSCEFTIEPGDRVTKGDEIGMFHFGGSSHCLVFRPETQLRFEDPGPYENEANNKKVRSLLAVAI